MSIFLLVDALFRCVAIAVQQSMSKLTGLHHVPQEMLKIEGGRSGGYIYGNLISLTYMDEVLRPVVLPFLCQNQC